MAEPAPRKRPKRPIVERRGLTIHIDGKPGPQLEAPIATRPQDWNLPIASWLFGEEAALRAHQGCCIERRQTRG